jgi:general secretion pathway protein I
MSMRPLRGFTFIEILIALAILAVALAAEVRSVGAAAEGTLELKERLLATWIAQDRLAEYTARSLWPDPGSRQGGNAQGGVQFNWRETVSATGNPRYRRVEVEVFATRASDRPVATFVGYAVRSE